MTKIISSNLLVKKIKSLSSPNKAIIFQRFFKTGKGQYGENDVFIGVTVPQVRQIAKEFCSLPFIEVQKLLNNKIHEIRLTGLLILVYKYQKTDAEKDKKAIYNFYIKNLKAVNNWDLVDTSTPNIVGNYLLDKNKQILYKLAGDKNLWKRRVSMLACFAFIKNRDFTDAIKIAEIHLSDKHDLMHKAVGWMLREIGKKDLPVLLAFLEANYNQIPRTTLRYAIERLEEKQRLKYLNKNKISN